MFSPFGNCEEGEHVIVWKPYPRGADGKNAQGEELGVAACINGDHVEAFGVPYDSKWDKGRKPRASS